MATVDVNGLWHCDTIMQDGNPCKRWLGVVTANGVLVMNQGGFESITEGQAQVTVRCPRCREMKTIVLHLRG